MKELTNETTFEVSPEFLQKNRTKKICGIYKITSPSGRIYIGSSKHIYRRLFCYRYPSYFKNQPKLWASINKHGYENHLMEVLILCTPEDRFSFERKIGIELDVLSSNNMNLTLPAIGDQPQIWSEESRKKQSLARKKIPIPQSTRDAVSRALKGKEQSPEHVEKRKVAGMKNGMFGRGGKAHHNWKKVYTEEQLKRFSEGQKKYYAEGGLNGRSKKVRNTATGEEFDTIKDAANSIGMKYPTLKAMMNPKNTNPNKTKFIKI